MATEHYHQVITLKNQNNEVIDDQITHIVVELSKFRKTLVEVHSDLDKLLYFMKQTDKPNFDQKVPDYFHEEWIDEAIKELDSAVLTPEQRAFLEMKLAGDVTDMIGMRNMMIEREKLAAEKAKQEANENAVKNLLELNLLDDAQIANVQGVSLAFVAAIREKMDRGE